MTAREFCFSWKGGRRKSAHLHDGSANRLAVVGAGSALEPAAAMA